jgi:hypothetical protein
MSIKRYVASKDSTITNAFKMDLRNRGTGSNMGASDVLETFSIYAQSSSTSTEVSRMLLQFPISDISTDRTNGKIPVSGSVSFYLRLYNAPHGETLPKDFTLVINPVSGQSWEEGNGMDMDEYSDVTNDGPGANWINASEGNTWVNPGGDFYTSSYSAGYNLNHYKTTFETGPEDLEENITALVEEWIAETEPNYGIGVYLTASQETGSSDPTVAAPQRSYYTKRFFSRTSEFFFKRPVIEARWDSSKKDKRGNFFFSSSLVPQADNLHTLYFYNFIRGQLKNIPNETGPVYVDIYSGTIGNTSPGTSSVLLPQGGGVPTAGTSITGGWVEKGIYSASFAVTASTPRLATLYDVWRDSNGKEFHTGSFTISDFQSLNHYFIPEYVTSIVNLRPSYHKQDVVRFKTYTRSKDWNPTIYSKASTDIETNIVEDAYYRVVRMVDNSDVVRYGTGSTNHTRISYDVSGSYFDLDMSLLEPGYAYGIRFVYSIGGNYEEQPELFKFRVLE